MNKMIWVIFLVILGVCIAYLISRYNKSTKNSSQKTSVENLKDQLVTVPELARLLAKDRAFVCEIGLDEYQPREIIQGLEMIIGFVFAMHNTAKSIFESDEYPTLDDKFIELIYSRIRLMPEIVQSQPDTLNYAEKCYKEVKRNVDQSQRKWDGMPLYSKFFEVCVRVLIEERKLCEPDIYAPLSDFGKLSCRSVLACAFKGVFSYVDWELDESGDNSSF